MRFAFIATLFLSIATWGVPAHADDLKHNWREEKVEGAFKLVSNYQAGAPFSENGEPEATLTMEASKAPANASLEDIVKGEVAGIGDGSLIIGNYAEEDGHKPVNGVASYIEKINGQKVGFIKYWVDGNTNGRLPRPRSVIHAIVLKKGKLWFVSLIALNDRHQSEVRSDQLVLVKSILKR